MNGRKKHDDDKRRQCLLCIKLATTNFGSNNREVDARGGSTYCIRNSVACGCSLLLELLMQVRF